MRLERFTLAALALTGTVLATNASAAPLPAYNPLHPASLILRTGERQAVAAGAIMGGAVGVLLGSQLARPAPPPVVYAAPPPEAEVIEEERIPVRRRVTRRIVEIDEAAPEIVEEDCVTRRSEVYDARSGRMILRKERDCR